LANEGAGKRNNAAAISYVPPYAGRPSYPTQSVASSVIVRNEATYKHPPPPPPQPQPPTAVEPPYGKHRGGTSGPIDVATEPKAPGKAAKCPRPPVPSSYGHHQQQQQQQHALDQPRITAQPPSSAYPGPLLNTHGVYALYPPSRQTDYAVAAATAAANAAAAASLQRDLPPPAHLIAKTTVVPPPPGFAAVVPACTGDGYEQTEPLDLAVTSTYRYDARPSSRSADTDVDVVVMPRPGRRHDHGPPARPMREFVINVRDERDTDNDRLANTTPLDTTMMCSSPARGPVVIVVPSTAVVAPTTTVSYSGRGNYGGSNSSNSSSGDGPSTTGLASVISTTTAAATVPKIEQPPARDSAASISPTAVAGKSTVSPTTRDSSPSTPPPVLTPATYTETTGTKTRHRKLKNAWLQRHAWTEDLKEAGVTVDRNASGSTLDDTPPVLQCEITKKRRKSNATDNGGDTRKTASATSSTSRSDETDARLLLIGGGDGGDDSNGGGRNNKKKRKVSIPVAEKKIAAESRGNSNLSNGNSSNGNLSNGNGNSSNGNGNSSNSSGNSSSSSDKEKKAAPPVKVPKKRGRKPKAAAGPLPLSMLPEMIRIDEADEELAIFQINSCINNVGFNLNKCRECRLFEFKRKKNTVPTQEEIDSIFCRFYAFRRILTKEGLLYNAGFSDPINCKPVRIHTHTHPCALSVTTATITVTAYTVVTFTRSFSGRPGSLVTQPRVAAGQFGRECGEKDPDGSRPSVLLPGEGGEQGPAPDAVHRR